MTTASSENQHYVPRFLLRNFASVKKKEHYINVFDKHQGRSFNTNVANIAAERGFYDFTHEGKTTKFEDIFSKLETKVADIFREIVSSSNLKWLSDADKDWISLFICVQQYRSPNFRAMTKSMDEQFGKRLEEMGFNPKDVEGYNPIPDDEEIKNFTIYFTFKSAEPFATLLKSKIWFLLSTTDGDPFWIGDNPVTLHNVNGTPHRGNLGLALKGIQIHLPLSPNLTLVLWCPSIVEEITTGLAHAQEMVQHEKMAGALYVGQALRASQERLAVASRTINSCSPIVEAVTGSTALECTSEYVKFYNALQVKFAERYIMSKTNNFELVKKMIRDEDSFSNGPRMKVM